MRRSKDARVQEALMTVPDDAHFCRCGEPAGYCGFWTNAPKDGSLDVAWARAEESLPEGWVIGLVPSVGLDRYIAKAGLPGTKRVESVGGLSPASALHNLALAMDKRHRKSERRANDAGKDPLPEEAMNG